MNGFIPENIIEEILSRIDIAEMVSSYFPMKKAGRNFKTLCPFHKENTASFIVSPDKQIFHCFGCGEGGNAIHFLMKYERLEFPEAVRLLAKRAGVVIPETDKKDKGEYSGLFRINELALQFFNTTLINSPGAEGARNYLNKRGLNQETIGKFKLGFSLPTGTSLVNFFKSKGEDLGLVRKSGLIVSRKDKDGFFDFFRGRIIYPILDTRSRVVGFGGRVLDETLPKYINSPETPVYKKGEILYGLNFSREAIREKNFTIIVEGYMDLISLFQAGIDNVVATSGTALTTDQIRLVKRISNSVVMVYDSDKAGELAALRGLELLLEENLDIKLVALPQGFDPDKFVSSKGKDAFQNKVKDAQNLFEYKLDLLKRQYDISDIDGKLKVVEEMLPTINKVSNMVLRAEFVKQFAVALAIDEESIWIELKKNSKSRGDYRKHASGKEEKLESLLLCSSIRESEAMLLKLMLEEKTFIKRVKQNLSEKDFLSPQVRKVVELLYTFDAENRDIEPARLVNYLNDDSSARVITKLLTGDVFGHNCDVVFEDCVKKIKEDNLRRDCIDLKEEILIAQKAGNSRRTEELLNEFNSRIRKKVQT